MTNDINAIEQGYLECSTSLVLQCVQFVGALTMMFWFSWQLAVAAILLSTLPIAASLAMGGELTRRERTVSDLGERYVSTIQGLLTGFSVLKSFKAEAQASVLFDRNNRELESAKVRKRMWQGFVGSVAGTCGLIFQMGVFLLGAYMAISGHITAGTVLTIVNLCNFVLDPIRTIPQYRASRKAVVGLVEKLAGLCAEHADRKGEPIEPALREGIDFRNVSFGYTPEKSVLNGVTLSLRAGGKYALVGGSGSGKSTLLGLLMGAYDYEGSIALDGRELKTVDTDSLYDLISLIGQSVFIFDDTIENNITLYKSFPEAQLSRAIERSGLSELVREKGRGYACGENGANLSGGERQRIAIARCLLRGTPVLLLDEATAALDNQAAFSVTDAILQLDGLTRVVVTHRLERPLLEQYDSIIVLRDGRIQEQGAFADLMDRKGFFYSLYTLES